MRRAWKKLRNAFFPLGNPLDSVLNTYHDDHPKSELATTSHHHHGPLASLSQLSLSNLFSSRENHHNSQTTATPPCPSGPDYTNCLTDAILRRIFIAVCPHATDDSFDSNETASLTERCFSCDTRDLANCALVKRSWWLPARNVLFFSIRLDVCHYCPLEEELAASRCNNDDPTPLRLKKLAYTLHYSSYLSSLVHFLKIPYMLREDPQCYGYLARAVSATPNLEYVDLPDAFFHADPSCHILRHELQHSCPNIRRMLYSEGAESDFYSLIRHGYWNNLRFVEISSLQVDIPTLRNVLASLRQLRELTLSQMNHIDDTLFHEVPTLPSFPAVSALALEKVPCITDSGLLDWLTRGDVRICLTSLSLTNSGVKVPNLYRILSAAPSLTILTVLDEVSAPLPLDPLPPLVSLSLTDLHFEILPAEDSEKGAIKPTNNYYSYLASSILAHGLPALRNLYVRDVNFADTLTLMPPVPHFIGEANGGVGGGACGGVVGSFFAPTMATLSSELTIYTKDINQDDWFSEVINAAARTSSLAAPSSPRVSSTFSISPANHQHECGSRSSIISMDSVGVSGGARPLSVYSASRGFGPLWGGEVRKSILVPTPSDTFINTMAVPPVPGSPGFPHSLVDTSLAGSSYYPGATLAADSSSHGQSILPNFAHSPLAVPLKDTLVTSNIPTAAIASNYRPSSPNPSISSTTLDHRVYSSSPLATSRTLNSSPTTNSSPKPLILPPSLVLPPPPLPLPIPLSPRSPGHQHHSSHGSLRNFPPPNIPGKVPHTVRSSSCLLPVTSTTTTSMPAPVTSTPALACSPLVSALSSTVASPSVAATALTSAAAATGTTITTATPLAINSSISSTPPKPFCGYIPPYSASVSTSSSSGTTIPATNSSAAFVNLAPSFAMPTKSSHSRQASAVTVHHVAAHPPNIYRTATASPRITFTFAPQAPLPMPTGTVSSDTPLPDVPSVPLSKKFHTHLRSRSSCLNLLRSSAAFTSSHIPPIPPPPLPFSSAIASTSTSCASSSYSHPANLHPRLAVTKRRSAYDLWR